ncbi:MAG: DNA repair protein RadA, partial [Chloroflexi bacterium]|nr:DNA repair protein RadA [Chloroflexota bacterium]
MGFCPGCGDRTPLVEAPMPDAPSSRGWTAPSASEPQELAEVPSEERGRISLRYREMDRVLGGGLVPGSVALFAGEPGVGKSTLLLQAADFVAAKGVKVLYVSGEESEQQIKLRSNRLGLSGRGIYLLAETDVDQIIHHLEERLPGLVVIDSIQTLSTAEASSGPGSVTQVRECALRLMRWAKARGTPVLLAGHVTKDGTLAGPRVLEHMVDVVLYLEGENLGAHRLLRSVKNRFGSTNEVAMFRIGDGGLEEVSDPSKALLEERGQGAVGSAVVSVLEGSRPLLVEIQALTSPSALPVPRRTANGVDYNRMIMITAVLGRRARLSLANQDIIVNVAGGLRVSEPGADLGMALAIASSFRNQPIKPGLVAIGEVGLSGELRSAPQTDRRLAEAARLGFSSCVLPTWARGKIPAIKGLELVYAPT